MLKATKIPNALAHLRHLILRQIDQHEENLTHTVLAHPNFTSPGVREHVIWERQIEKSFAKEIRDYVNGQTTTDYWIKRREVTKGIWKTIDWDSIGRAMQEILVNRRRWVSKYVSGHFATGKNMCRWHFRSSTQCPRCGDPQEDKHHILICHVPEAQELWEKSLKAVKRWLKDKGMDT